MKEFYVRDWFVAVCEVNREFEAKRQLESRGVTVFLPTFLTKDKGRHVRLRLLFRKYLFFSLLNPRSWPTVKNTYGISEVLTYRPEGKSYLMPTPIDSSAIESLRHQCLSITDKMDHRQSYINEGCHVRIINGPFKDEHQSAIVEWADDERASLLMDIFNRHVKAQFFIRDLELINAG